MKRRLLTAAAACLLTVLPALMVSFPSSQAVAGRYPLRTRTTRFFQRATTSGRILESQRRPQRNVPNVRPVPSRTRPTLELPNLFLLGLPFCG